MQGKKARHPAEKVAKTGVAVVATYLLAVFAIDWAQDRAMGTLVVGDREARARGLFWFTPDEETSARAGPASGWTTTSTRCAAPCVRRLWWVHPLLPDLEAWTVDLDGEGKVIGRYRWSSP